MNHVDWLPLAYAALFAGSLIAYALMDGWDLGVGVLYLLIARRQNREEALRSIEPFWDANETWLVLGGMTLLLGFPLAYAELLSRLYLPACGLLLALVLRGVTYEFRYQDGPLRDLWGALFAAGSIIATFCQGCMLGLVVEGVPETSNFSPLLSALRDVFPVLCGIGLIGGYGLLGACWLILKTNDALQTTAREVALPALLMTAGFLLIVAIFTPLVSPHVAARWFTDLGTVAALVMALAIGIVVRQLWGSLWQPNDRRPLLLAIVLTLLSFVGLIVSIFPYVVPYKYTLYEAANDRNSLKFAGIGICVVLPIILLYLTLGYRVFRGKISAPEDAVPQPPSLASRRTSGHKADLHMS